MDSKHDFTFSNVEIWQNKANDVNPKYERLPDEEQNNDFTTEVAQLGEVIRIDASHCTIIKSSP